MFPILHGNVMHDPDKPRPLIRGTFTDVDALYEAQVEEIKRRAATAETRVTELEGLLREALPLLDHAPVFTASKALTIETLCERMREALK